jgi:hypothetical protein
MRYISKQEASLKASVPVPSQEVTDEFYQNLIAQSGGISVGIILAFLGSVAIARWFGLGDFIKGWMKRMEESTDALKELALSFKIIDKNLADNHHQYIRNHKRILDKIDEVKEELGDLRDELKDSSK